METKQHGPKAGGRRPYSSGDAARKIYGNLLRDFKTSARATDLAGEQLLYSAVGIKAFRARPERELGMVPVQRFKQVRQLESLLKKFRFSTDAYSDKELTDRSANAFLEEQIRLHCPMSLKLSGHRVLQRARLIARRILGEYPGDEVIENVRFGKKSSIGCPLSLAYIDVKLSDKRAFTGTREATKVFLDQVLPGDHILQRILTGYDFSQLKGQLSLTHLNLVDVPKTWKVFRLITPLTLLGLFFSYGIGRVVQARLKDAGLDIRTLQFRHRELVKKFSESRSHATADLHAASDSITSELLNRILPRPWYNAVKKTFVRNLNVYGNVYSTASVLPMGNGATFPLETLVFYSIIKAIGELTDTKGIYSVYGDDLIYPSRLHKYVVGMFPQFHLVLNLDKTFVRYPFRESCGSDYYRGQDVRPHFIKGEDEQLTKVRYQAFLYKAYNGLVARWEPIEIRATLTWILSELAIVANTILRVPPSFPDYSGLKVSTCQYKPLGYDLLPWSPILIQFNNGSRWFQFDFLTETPNKRVVKSTEPYYWLSLQGLNDDVVDEYGGMSSADQAQASHAYRLHSQIGVWKALRGDPYWRALSSAPYSPVDKPNVALCWKKVTKKKVIYQNKRKIVKKRTRFFAVVSSRKGGAVSTATTRTDSISDWI